jgi:hypothetical protein
MVTGEGHDYDPAMATELEPFEALVLAKIQ